jgi:hypothetical protein
LGKVPALYLFPFANYVTAVTIFKIVDNNATFLNETGFSLHGMLYSILQEHFDKELNYSLWILFIFMYYSLTRHLGPR